MTMSESSSGGKKKEDALLATTRHVRALLISAPNGLNIVELQNDYLSIIGKPFPYRELGYKTPLDLLKAMPDVVRTTWDSGELILKGIADETSKHIAKLVAKQKKDSKKRRATRVIISQRTAQAPNVPFYIRSKIKELLVYYPSGVLGSMFCLAFFRHFHTDLDFKRLGFSQLQDLLRSLPDIVKIENIKGGGYRVYGIINHDMTQALPSAHSSSNVTSEHARNSSAALLKKQPENISSVNKIKKLLDSNSGISSDLKNQIAQILCKRPNGVWAARLPVEYKKTFGKELGVRDYGFANVVELADAMPDIVRIERPTKTGDWLLHRIADSYEEHSPVAPDMMQVPRKPGKRDDLYIEKSCRSTPVVQDGVEKGTYFKKLKVPDSGYFSLYVSHCIDPHNFWVIFTDEWPKLEALGKDLSTFYNDSEGDAYNMPERLISVGQVCCAWSADFEDWFRAVITGVGSIQNIEVFYVDYGNTSRVTLSELRILRSAFLNLPGQAVYSQLAYIKPLKRNEWSPGGCHRFYHITKNYKPLFGLLCGNKDGKLCLCLSDTSSPEDVHINDLLVDEGYALFCPDSPVTPDSPVKFFPNHTFNGSTEKHQPENTSVRQPPGLPPARQGQQFFNQHIASAMSTCNTTIPDFPLQLNMDKTTESLMDRIVSHNSYQRDVQGRTPALHTEDRLHEQGDGVATGDDLAFIEEVCNELGDSMQKEYYLKRINLADMCTIHVINYHKKPHLTSADISALFWDSDVLRSMLRQKKLAIPKVVLSVDEDQELMEELVKYEVRGTVDNGFPRSFVTLYPLNSLPEILCTFNHPLEELVSRVELEIRQFENEGDDYWLVSEAVNDSADSESQDEGFSTDTEQLAVEELKLVIQAMQFRRKRILQSLMTPSGSCSAQNTVEELLEVETKIENLRLEVSRKEKDEQNSDRPVYYSSKLI